jgi:hypothetical protein
MSEENQPQLPAASVAVVLNPLALRQVYQFRERYAQYQACEDTAESQALAKQVDDLAFKLACSVESALEQVEAEQVVKVRR